MKRKEMLKVLKMSGLSLVVATSLLLGGCGNTENEKEVKTTTEASEIKDTKKESKKIAKADEKVSNETQTQVASGETKTEEVKEDTKDSKGTEEKSDKSDKTGNSSSSGSTSSNSNSGNSSSGGSSNSGNSGNSGNHSGGGNTSNGGNSGNSGNTGSTSHTPTPAPSNGGGNSNSGGGSSSTTPTHTHNWIPITQTIHHPAETRQEDQGHYETVVDQEAYDEEVPIMEYGCFCKTCYNRGSIVRLHGQEETTNHILWHYTECGDSSVQTVTQSMQVGTQIVHHDAVTHQEWVSNIVTVTVKEAWDEVVTVGYQCSECGATK